MAVAEVVAGELVGQSLKLQQKHSQPMAVSHLVCWGLLGWSWHCWLQEREAWRVCLRTVGQLQRQLPPCLSESSTLYINRNWLRIAWELLS